MAILRFGALTEMLEMKTIMMAIGAKFKENMCEPGDWGVYMSMQGEVIPKQTNHVRLSKDEKDEWGIPQLITSVDYDDNDEKMLKDFLTQGEEILKLQAVPIL